MPKFIFGDKMSLFVPIFNFPSKLLPQLSCMHQRESVSRGSCCFCGRIIRRVFPHASFRSNNFFMLLNMLLGSPFRSYIQITAKLNSFSLLRNTIYLFIFWFSTHRAQIRVDEWIFLSSTRTLERNECCNVDVIYLFYWK